jgi:hypothetical protein
MARSSECKEQYAQKTLDTADIVREAIFQYFFLRAQAQKISLTRRIQKRLKVPLLAQEPAPC